MYLYALYILLSIRNFSYALIMQVDKTFLVIMNIMVS